MGTFSVPQKEKLLEKPISFGYYMDREKLLFVDESGFVAHIVKEMEEIRFQEQSYVAHFLFEFMERLLEDDVRFLQAYELRMTDLEDGLFRREIKDCPARMLTVRRELLRMNTYYDQLADFCEMLEENYTGFLGEEDWPFPSNGKKNRAPCGQHQKPAGIYPSDPGNVSGQNCGAAEQDHAVPHRRHHYFHAPDADHRLVWHELCEYAGALL